MRHIRVLAISPPIHRSRVHLHQERMFSKAILDVLIVTISSTTPFHHFLADGSFDLRIEKQFSLDCLVSTFGNQPFHFSWQNVSETECCNSLFVWSSTCATAAPIRLLIHLLRLVRIALPLAYAPANCKEMNG